MAAWCVSTAPLHVGREMRIVNQFVFKGPASQQEAILQRRHEALQRQQQGAQVEAAEVEAQRTMLLAHAGQLIGVARVLHVLELPSLPVALQRRVHSVYEQAITAAQQLMGSVGNHAEPGVAVAAAVAAAAAACKRKLCWRPLPLRSMSARPQAHQQTGRQQKRPCPH
jgi:hypothetical protein